MRTPHSVLLGLLAALGCASPAPRPRAPQGLAYPEATVKPTATSSAVPTGPSNASPGATLTPSARGSLGAFGSAPFAGEGPLLLEGVASDGGWVALCQARRDSDGDGKLGVSFSAHGEARGDALERLLVAPGEELAIDGLLTSSADGRYALVLQRGALVLWDQQSRQSVDLTALGADARLSAESFAELRTAAFDASSQHLLYARTGEQGPRVVLRTLSDGSERELDPGPGPIWRARLDPGGAFAVLEMMTSDSNKNGRADFPAPLLPAPRACAAQPGRFHVWTDRGDRPETVLLPLNGAPAVHDPDLVMPIGDALLERDANGALLLDRAGKKRLLEPAACKGRIVHADARRDLFIVGCVQKKHTGRVSLELITKSERRPLGLELASVELDRELSDSPRLVPLYPGPDSVLFDADRREVLPLQTGDVVIATRNARALVRRGKSLVFYDAETRSELSLPPVIDKYPDVLVAGSFAFVTPALVDLDAGTLVGSSTARPLGLSTTGALLISDSPTTPERLVDGPLRWLLLGSAQ